MSAANKSGNDTLATRTALTYLRTQVGGAQPAISQPLATRTALSYLRTL